MSSETLMFVERLTAPKPNWVLAMVMMKGVQPIPIGSKYAKVRKNGDYLIITIIGATYPDGQPQGSPNEHICDLETHAHIDELVHVDFYSNVRLAPKANTTELQTEKSDLIMPTQKEVDAAGEGKLVRI